MRWNFTPRKWIGAHYSSVVYECTDIRNKINASVSFSISTKCVEHSWRNCRMNRVQHKVRMLKIILLVNEHIFKYAFCKKYLWIDGGAIDVAQMLPIILIMCVDRRQMHMLDVHDRRRWIQSISAYTSIYRACVYMKFILIDDIRINIRNRLDYDCI